MQFSKLRILLVDDNGEQENKREAYKFRSPWKEWGKRSEKQPQKQITYSGN